MRLTPRSVGVWLADAVPVIRKPARAIYNRLPSCFHETPAKLIARTFSREVPFFFISIGANDGIAGDPLVELVRHNGGCKGIFVEPVAFLFERLRKNYGDDSERFIFENVAIGEYDGLKKFYYLDRNSEGGLPDWAEEIGSFDKSHILRHFPTLTGSQILCADVKCVTLLTLLARNQVGHVDLLVIDVEGYELGVLRQIDFSVIKPRVIIFEHKHLTDAEFSSAKAILLGNDYRLIQFGRDTVATLLT